MMTNCFLEDGVTVMGLVSIKGTKEGLVFRLDDQAEFTEVIEDLTYKLSDKQAQLLHGPEMDVTIQLNDRQISSQEERLLRELLSAHPNLIITKIESNAHHYLSDYDPLSALENVSGTVRSGQVLEASGSLLLLGDVNPGGTVRAGGHIFILGALRGTAQAGYYGNEEVIIAASKMCPMQLHIGTTVNRSPDEGQQREGYMEFAHLSGEHIAIEQISQLYRVRPELQAKTNWQLI